MACSRMSGTSSRTRRSPRPAKARGEIREALQRATLVEGGKLTEKHEWLYGLLDKASSATKRQKAVVLGAG